MKQYQKTQDGKPIDKISLLTGLSEDDINQIITTIK
jgi:hypothetical protein